MIKKKRLSYEEKKHQAVVDLINKMFEIACHDITYDDIKDRKDEWYLDWGMTYKQNQEWYEWGKQYIKKAFKLNDYLASKEMGMISLMWGLKFLDFPEQTNK